MHEDATIQRLAVRPSAYREGMEGVALGRMFLVCNQGDSRQLCDPESTFKRQLKHKQAPKPTGIAHLLLQIIKQIKRGQRRCKTTIVYLWGLRGLLERWSVHRFASWLQNAHHLCQHFALAQSCVGADERFCGPSYFSTRMCKHSSSYLCARFGGCVHCVVGLENIAAEAVSA